MGKLPIKRLMLIGATIVVFIPTVVSLYRVAGAAAFALALVPALLAGGILGTSAGVVVALFICGVSLVLQVLLGVPFQDAIVQDGVGIIGTVICGYGFGRLYELNRKSKRQAAEWRRAEWRAARLSRQLEQAQKMEALGTLSGGIAHDLNNILGVIMTAGSMIESDLEPKDPHAEDVRDILAAVRRGRSLIRNLLEFARKSPEIKEVVSLPEIIRVVVGILKRSLDKKIAVKVHIQEGNFNIAAKSSQLEQALINLSINAAAAMGETGTLVLSLKSVDIKADDAATTLFVEPNRVEPGPYFQIEVTDSGQGMDSQALEHIFEPFYTTKPRGQGSGLGLFMVYGTVKNLGGAIRIASTLGVGTTVTLMLPDNGVRPAASVAQSRHDNTLPGSGRILLVDDEKLLRKTGSRLLKKLGYEVLIAENGIEGLQVFAEQKSDLDLVILDLVMPEMDGMETFVKLKEIDPEVRVLISSGYEKSEKIEYLLNNGATGFLQKPFEIDELTKRLNIALY